MQKILHKKLFLGAMLCFCLFLSMLHHDISPSPALDQLQKQFPQQILVRDGMRKLQMSSDSVAQEKPDDGVGRAVQRPTERSASLLQAGQETSRQNRSFVRFLFVVGTAGAGHSFLRRLLTKAAFEKIASVRLELEKLILMLWNEPLKNGFFNSHCSANTSSDELLGSEKPIVAQLIKVQSVVQSQMAKKIIRGEVVLPLNILEVEGAGMMSYPNSDSDCIALAYPDLDALYHACDEAQVECSHLLVYREPYAVINATSRSPSQRILRQIKVMGTMLGVILAQMLNQEQRRYWCWEYGKVEGWSEAVGEAFGLEAQELSAGFDRISNQSAGVAPSERDKIVPRHAQVHMQSLLLTTQRLQRMCASRHAR